MLRAVALLLVCAGLFALPAAARADDLIQLNGDTPVTFGGTYSYGLLYLDGAVRLSADTSITATDVFIGPDASLQTCYDLATAGNNCTNGRSLSITASGGVAIQPGIDLRGLVGTNRAGGALVIKAARVALGGPVETAGTNAPSGGIVIDSSGLVVTQTLHAPGNNIIVHGAGGVAISGDVWSAGSDTATQQRGRAPDERRAGRHRLHGRRRERARRDLELGTRRHHGRRGRGRNRRLGHGHGRRRAHLGRSRLAARPRHGHLGGPSGRDLAHGARRPRRLRADRRLGRRLDGRLRIDGRAGQPLRHRRPLGCLGELDGRREHQRRCGRGRPRDADLRRRAQRRRDQHLRSGQPDGRHTGAARSA